MFDEGDRLIDEIRTKGDPDGERSNALLNLLHDGYPLNNLRKLTSNESDEVAAIGAWILSELGIKGRELFEEVKYLLEHPFWKARFWAIESILAFSTPDDGEQIARIFQLSFDPHAAVRGEVINFLERKNSKTQQSALKYLGKDNNFLSYEQGVRMLSELNPDSIKEIRSSICSSSKILRMFGAAAAVRFGKTYNNWEALELAKQNSDDDISKYAEIKLRRRH
jgi:hypothetical protein